MLYIDVKVNGHPVKAFVDSGAQTTIMSPSCAETCGIMRLIDTRWASIARGVGTAKILGRVHSADIRIGDQIMPCSFTVMEGKDVDLLLGLDMLKRHQASIDLRRNKLVLGEHEVEFLPESDIPKWMDEAQKAEPTVRGPDGTEIGTKSGTIRSAGKSASTDPSGSNTAGPSEQSLATDPPQPALQPTPAASGASSSARGGGGIDPLETGPSPTSARSGAGNQTGRVSHPEQKIEQLVGLGFSRDQAISALDATDGDVEYAAGLLFR